MTSQPLPPKRIFPTSKVDAHAASHVPATSQTESKAYKLAFGFHFLIPFARFLPRLSYLRIVYAVNSVSPWLFNEFGNDKFRQHTGIVSFC